jgi:hypothetical protein
MVPYRLDDIHYSEVAKERAAAAIAVLAVGFSHARDTGGNRTSSIAWREE